MECASFPQGPPSNAYPSGMAPLDNERGSKRITKYLRCHRHCTAQHRIAWHWLQA